MEDLSFVMTQGYRGCLYEAKVVWNEQDSLYVGVVTNLRDVITFCAGDKDDLENEFMESILDYVEFCELTAESCDGSCNGCKCN